MAKPKRESHLVSRLLPVLSVIIAVAVFVFLHEKYKKTEAVGRAGEVAQYELRLLTDSFNYRLNDLREELLHLYGEQANLARALSEAERERLVFYRRDYLAAYAVLVPGSGGKWDIQKYFMRDGTNRDVDAKAIGVFKDSITNVKTPGFSLKRVESSVFGTAGLPKNFGADAYVLAYSIADEDGKPFGLVGVFRPSYVFPFCRYFAEQLGMMPVNVFVLDERGTAVCHSQSRFDGVSFKEMQMYPTLSSASSGVVRYSNTVNTNVSAAVKKIEPGSFLFVAEAAEVHPFESLVPWRDLAIAGGAIFLVTLLSLVLTRPKARATDALLIKLKNDPDANIEPEFEKEDPTMSSANEFTKLRHELKELERALLEMQSTQAYIAGFQKAATDYPLDSDLVRMTLEYLASHPSLSRVPIMWLEANAETHSLRSGVSVQMAEPLASFKIEWGAVASENLGHDPEFVKLLSDRIGLGEIFVQPVHFISKCLGLIVVVEKAPEKHGQYKELLPQIAQTFAYIYEARNV